MHGDDPGSLTRCVYPDPRPRAAPLGKVQRATLEAEIGALASLSTLRRPRRVRVRRADPFRGDTAELKATVEQLRAANTYAASAYPSAASSVLPPRLDRTDPTRLSSLAASTFASAAFSNNELDVELPSVDSAIAYLAGGQSASPRTFGPPPSGEAWSLHSSAPPTLSPSATTLTSSTSAASPFTPPSSDPLLELLYPGWPRDLPPPTLTHRLIDDYFARPHQCSDIVNPSRFRTALCMPPTSAGFPHPALIHVMCAVACLMIPDDFFRGESCYWQGYERAADFHIARTKVRLAPLLPLDERDRG